MLPFHLQILRVNFQVVYWSEYDSLWKGTLKALLNEVLAFKFEWR